ncbi:MAG: transposase [Desulfobacteraceae bacterium]|nr:transposase [Desulfobacteraceae bacterium]
MPGTSPVYRPRKPQNCQYTINVLKTIQPFGDFLGFNPHLHVLVSDGSDHKQNSPGYLYSETSILPFQMITVQDRLKGG